MGTVNLLKNMLSYEYIALPTFKKGGEFELAASARWVAENLEIWISGYLAALSSVCAKGNPNVSARVGVTDFKPARILCWWNYRVAWAVTVSRPY